MLRDRGTRSRRRRRRADRSPRCARARRADGTGRARAPLVRRARLRGQRGRLRRPAQLVPRSSARPTTRHPDHVERPDDGGREPERGRAARHRHARPLPRRRARRPDLLRPVPPRTAARCRRRPRHLLGHPGRRPVPRGVPRAGRGPRDPRPRARQPPAHARRPQPERGGLGRAAAAAHPRALGVGATRRRQPARIARALRRSRVGARGARARSRRGRARRGPPATRPRSGRARTDGR